VAQVIDASLAVAWCAHTQATRLSDAALAATIENGGNVPPQFWFEVLHSLSRLQRRGVVDRARVEEFLRDLSGLSLVIEGTYDATGMIELHAIAQQHTLSIYDAAYLELALRLDIPLATRDARLTRAATAAGARLFKA
jgi:predicted nucleic acid-binding protein